MTAQFAFCRLSGGACLAYRCPLAERTADRWLGSRDGWLRWDSARPPDLEEPGKARLNLYLRLHDLPIPTELRLAPIGPTG